MFFFFQAEDGIRDHCVTGVQTCALPILVADGRAVRYPIAWVRVRLDERTQPTLVVCGDSGTEPLLGAFTLEGFGLGVDPVNRRLIPVPGLLKAVAGGPLVSQFHFRFLI